MTAGALAFWQKHANNRQTIAYAVSVDHAHNLAAVFNDSGIPAAIILGDTNREERDKAIVGFQDGSIRVLVNVIVATEGFDLPDASCIIIAPPHHEPGAVPANGRPRSAPPNPTAETASSWTWPPTP